MFKKITVIAILIMFLSACATNPATNKHKSSDKVKHGLLVAGVAALALVAALDKCPKSVDDAAQTGWDDGFHKYKKENFDHANCKSDLVKFYDINYDRGMNSQPIFRAYGSPV